MNDQSIREQAKLKELFDDLAKDLRVFYRSNAQDSAYGDYQSIMGKHISIIKKAIESWCSLKIYRHRDARLKCCICHRYMKYKPTIKTPLVRAEAPKAGTCVECLGK